MFGVPRAGPCCTVAVGLSAESFCGGLLGGGGISLRALDGLGSSVRARLPAATDAAGFCAAFPDDLVPRPAVAVAAAPSVAVAPSVAAAPCVAAVPCAIAAGVGCGPRPLPHATNGIGSRVITDERDPGSRFPLSACSCANSPIFVDLPGT